MLSLPRGEIFIDEVKRENSVCMTNNPARDEIIFLFREYKKATKLIYVENKQIKKEYNRQDFTD